MHSFLVSTSPKLPESPDVLHLYPDKSLGIEETRQISIFLSRKPLTLEQNTVVIHEAEKLTVPAQHAILKILEEPPGQSLIYLVTDFPDQLLPTIISRTQTEDNRTDASVNKKRDTVKTSELVTELFKAGVGGKLKLIDDQNFTRDSALKFLQQLEYVLHDNLNLPIKYDLIHKTRRYLSGNVNVRLAMDNFALSL
jgi:DNA polymerase III delta prime subunit